MLILEVLGGWFALSFVLVAVAAIGFGDIFRQVLLVMLD